MEGSTGLHVHLKDCVDPQGFQVQAGLNCESKD
jgi:hypothetical protein